MAQIATTGAFCGAGIVLQAVQQGVVLETVFGHVGDKHGGLGRDQEELLQQRLLFLAEVQRAHRLGLVQCGLAVLQNATSLADFLVAAERAAFGNAVQRLFHRAQVGQAQLGLDHLDVGDRIDLAGDMDHVVVFKAAHHVDDGVGLADVRQKLVAQALAGAGTGHQPAMSTNSTMARWTRSGLHDGGQRVKPRVRHFDHAHIGLDGAKGVVFSRNAGLGQGVEQGRFTDVGQAHDATFHEISL